MVRIFNVRKSPGLSSILLSITLQYFIANTMYRGEKALVASSINRNMVDSDAEDDEKGPRQRIGKKTDCIGHRLAARRQDGEELLLMEVVGPPCNKNEIKRKRDRAALLRGMKLSLDRVISTMRVDRARRVRVYGILVYGESLLLYLSISYEYFSDLIFILQLQGFGLPSINASFYTIRYTQQQ
jgi:hypothetical protein